MRYQIMKPVFAFLIWLSGGVSYSAIAQQPLNHQIRQNECVAPTRPADDQDDVSWQKFLDDIDVFQACINARVERQQAASKEHQEAARSAVDLWNQFVQQSLNAPEDFPWPPETD